jgi:3-deoxy-D-manno-octulosonate 8-phosphate phosphatase KdsC-like HAD superfamily phosphatase
VYIYAQADMVLNAKRGAGAFGELADKILDAQGKTDHLYFTSASSQQAKPLGQ